MYVDLHVHTMASDGSCTPEEVVALASEMGLGAIAITDHDSIDGVDRAISCAPQNLEIVPGIELSSEFKGREIHLLGYFIDISSEDIHRAARWSVEDRLCRNEKMIAKLQSDGFDISMPKMCEKYPDSVIGRPHIAGYLSETGQTPSVSAAFCELLGENCKYYVKRNYLPLDVAVKSIISAGGVAVLAHPLLYGFNKNTLSQLINQCVDLGLKGIEAIYPGFTEEEIGFLKALTEEEGIMYTGGSDFHGANKPDIHLGEVRVPEQVLYNLKSAAGI